MLLGWKELSVQCFSLKAHGMIGGWLVFQPKVDPHVIICVEIPRIVRHHQPSPLKHHSEPISWCPKRVVWRNFPFQFRRGDHTHSRITPWKINGWNIQITHLERKIIFQTSMIMFHVNLPGCIQQYYHTVEVKVRFARGLWCELTPTGLAALSC